MSKWEDIVKDKLRGYESNLPGNSLVAFHVRRAAAGATKAKRFPLICAVIPAIAAGLASILFLREPTVPEDDIQLIPGPLIAKTAQAQSAHPAHETAQTEVTEATTAVEVIRISEEPPIPETNDIDPEDTPEEPAIDNRPDVSDYAPFVHQTSANKTAVQINMSTGGAIAAGGGLLAALATQLAKADLNGIVPGRFGVENVNGLGKTASHRMPLVVGLSIRFPITEKIGITTGLEYSLYTSLFSYPTGEKTQLVHYLGIPVRFDWTFVSGKWFDAYLGMGVKGDICIRATFDGQSLGKDGPAFRLLSAGGIQFRLTRNLSLFVEPEISWTLPSDRRVLSIYSSEHPWMFSIATGLRIDFLQFDKP